MLSNYVDYFIIVSHSPDTIVQQLKLKYHIKGEPEAPDSYLGMNFIFKDRKLHFGLEYYITELVIRIERIKKTLQKNSTLLEPNDHSELDSSDILDPERISQYQGLVGMIIWVVILCRPDIFHASITLARYQNAPTIRYLERALRVWGYLKKEMEKDAEDICIRLIDEYF